MSLTVPGAAAEPPSQYELEREANIRENNEQLRSLGLTPDYGLTRKRREVRAQPSSKRPKRQKKEDKDSLTGKWIKVFKAGGTSWSKSPKWYVGKVGHRLRDGRFNIKYANDPRKEDVAVNLGQSAEGDLETWELLQRCEAPKECDRIQVLWLSYAHLHNRGWYEGTVRKRNDDGTYIVKYDDGDKQLRVKLGPDNFNGNDEGSWKYAREQECAQVSDSGTTDSDSEDSDGDNESLTNRMRRKSSSGSRLSPDARAAASSAPLPRQYEGAFWNAGPSTLLRLVLQGADPIERGRRVSIRTGTPVGLPWAVVRVRGSGLMKRRSRPPPRTRAAAKRQTTLAAMESVVSQFVRY